MILRNSFPSRHIGNARHSRDYALPAWLAMAPVTNHDRGAIMGFRTLREAHGQPAQRAGVCFDSTSQNSTSLRHAPQQLPNVPPPPYRCETATQPTVVELPADVLGTFAGGYETGVGFLAVPGLPPTCSPARLYTFVYPISPCLNRLTTKAKSDRYGPTH